MTWSDIPGWFDFADAYDKAIDEAKDGAVFAEIGCWLGRSTAYLADAIKRSGKDITLYAVDSFVGVPEGDPESEPYRGRNICKEFIQNMRDCGADDVVRLIQSDSAEAAACFVPDSLDFVFIDADHSYQGVSRDIAAWRPKVKAGGIVAGHDRIQDGVKRAVAEAFGMCEEIGPLVWWVRV